MTLTPERIDEIARETAEAIHLGGVAPPIGIASDEGVIRSSLLAVAREVAEEAANTAESVYDPEDGHDETVYYDVAQRTCAAAIRDLAGRIR
jgi:hypothetical protein